ncbi:FtsX-like permease family protein [Bariatricus massiliensis]|uniref:FtsX-like permease family protein n=1 Tax=Bariatricus massiliensis TaxID=1745713 RepID=A0ABS8DGT1_9FIRM|nr:FtsX-like permease family protein [Bariatricus massiliensis]MCB7304518.1 FtsX-like permease family protein [Bariatricus massiliensis]MCB7375170.1 FtsX-like permease family protein [Bariatricus massiliensis]MCB7387629.1 FtsX-like permease family protein [Bariatricus massiliensis]MCB7411790.1 FtsX-like permease family protein [Bariatricus massiliensis]MCQ5253926.1 FtsX-like permease family protein [Bariatricus massiliensis]
MGIWLIVKGDIRKRKGQAAIIIILSLLISMLLATTVSVLVQSHEQYDKMAEKANVPEAVNIFMEGQTEEADTVFDKLKERPETKSVSLEDILLFQSPSIKLGGEEWYSNLTILREYPDGYELAEGRRGEQGIYLPISLKSIEHIKIGDVVVLKLDGRVIERPVAGFFEDPFLGGAMIGVKQVFLEAEEFDSVFYMTESAARKGKLLGIWTETIEGKSFADKIKALNKETGLSEGGSMYMEQSLIKMAMLILTDIFLSLLFLFSLLLLAVMLVTVRYMLASSLEDDYKEIGILSTMGYTRGRLLGARLLQVFVLCAVGGATGFAGALAAIPSFGNFALDETGILWHGGIAVLPALLAVSVIFVIVLSVTLKSLWKVKKISPVQAIRNGKADVHFKRRYQIPLTKLHALPLPLRLAVKNVFSSLPQYLLLIVVCGFLIFSLISISALNENMQDLKKTAALFGSAVADISVTDHLEETEENRQKFQVFLDKLKESEGIEQVYSYDQQYVDMDGFKMLLGIDGSFGETTHQKPIEGRAPKYDNEMMLTKIASQYLGKEIGDTVTISLDGAKADFLVTGLYQSSSDAGKIGAVMTEGYRRLVPDFGYTSCEILLEDNKNLEESMQEVEELGAEEGLDLQVEDSAAQVNDMMKDAQAGIVLLVVFFYMLSILISALITFLLAITLLKRQRHEFAVYRSMGYPVRTLRTAFACSFGMIGIMGAAFGLAAALLLTSRLFSAIFSNVGISEFKADITVTAVLLPILIITGFMMLFSYYISRKIRRYGVRQLAEE